MWLSVWKFRIGVIVYSIRFQRCGGLFPTIVGLNQNVSDASWPNITRSLISLNTLFFFLKENFSFWFSLIPL